MADSQPPKRYTCLVFGLFSLAGFYFIVYQMYASKAPDRFLEIHKASLVPVTPSGNLLPYLDSLLEHIPHSDKIFTPLISFFVAAFGDTSSPAYSTVTNFVWSFGCAIQIPLVEAQRNGVSGSRHTWTWLLSFPMVWGVLYQRLSGGWIIPIWLVAFMLSRSRAESAGIEKLQAESVVAGWWLGHTIPALFMLVPGQPAPTHTPYWVAFPILMTIVQRAYLLVQKKLFARVAGSQLRNSGYSTVQALYLSGFVAASMAHVHLVVIPCLTNASFTLPTHETMVNKFIGLAQAMHCFFAPTTGIETPSPASTTATTGVVHFVQFDIIVVFGAIWVALLWDFALKFRCARYDVARAGLLSGLCAMLWKPVLALIACAIVLSPGAATSAFLMYREYEISKKASRGVKRKSTLPSEMMDEKVMLDG